MYPKKSKRNKVRYLAFYINEVDFGILEMREIDQDYKIAKATSKQAHADLLHLLQAQICKIEKIKHAIQTTKTEELIIK